MCQLGGCDTEFLHQNIKNKLKMGPDHIKRKLNQKAITHSLLFLEMNIFFKRGHQVLFLGQDI